MNQSNINNNDDLILQYMSQATGGYSKNVKLIGSRLNVQAVRALIATVPAVWNFQFQSFMGRVSRSDHKGETTFTLLVYGMIDTPYGKGALELPLTHYRRKQVGGETIVEQVDPSN